MKFYRVSIRQRSWFSRQWADNRSRLLLFAIIAAAFALRYSLAGVLPYGSGEAEGLLSAGEGTWLPHRHPLFMVAVRLWLLIGMGENAWSMRLLPVLLGTALVYAVYWLTGRLFGRRYALVAALFAAVSPVLTACAVEVLPGALSLCTVVLMTGVLLEVRSHGGWDGWALYSLSVGLALYTSPETIYMACILLLWMVALRPGIRPVAYCLAATIGGFLLYAPYAWRLGQAGMLVAAASGYARAYATSWGRLAALPDYMTNRPAWALVHLLLLLASGLGLWIAFRSAPKKALLLTLLLIGPVLGGLAWAYTGHPSDPWLLAWLVVSATVLTALAVNTISKRWVRELALWAVAALLFLLQGADISKVLSGTDRDLQESHQPYDKVARFLSERCGAGDAVVCDKRSAVGPLAYYAKGCRAVQLAAYGTSPKQGAGSLGLHGKNRPPWEPVEVEVFTRDASRVWLVRPREAAGTSLCATTKAWLDDHLFETAMYHLDGIEVFLFERKVGGKWTSLKVQDKTDGGSADLVYDAGTDRTYHKTWGPPGDVFLRFEAPLDGAKTIKLASGALTKRQGFSIENRGSTPVTGTLRVAATNVLLELTRLVERWPHSSVWTFGHGDCSGSGSVWPSDWVRAELSSAPCNEADLIGGIALQAGSYYVYIYDHHGRSKAGSPIVSLKLGSAIVSQDAVEQGDGSGPWRWRRAGEKSMPRFDGWVPVTLSANLPAGAERGEYRAAYLALVRRQRDVSAADSMKHSFFEKRFSLERGKCNRYTCICDATKERIDVWFEADDSAQGTCRIFTPLPQEFNRTPERPAY
jgi:hypothetical protein